MAKDKAIKFVCTADGCPNKDVDYNWENPNETHAMCGGCGIELEAQDA